MEFLQEHLQTLQEVVDRSKSNTKRIDELWTKSESWANLSEAIIKLGSEQEHMGKDITETKENVKEISNDLRELREKPGKRWESIVEKVIWTVIAAALGFALAKVFK